MKIEILGGEGLERAFKALNIKAKRTYRGSKEPYYEVWEIEKSDLYVLEDAEWKDAWGYWRYAKGSNMGTACSFFQVNGKELIAWDGDKRDYLIEDWFGEDDNVKSKFHYSMKEYEEKYMPREYDTLLEYLCEELGVSTARNVCALAVDLAKTNGYTMAELFEEFEE